MQAKAARRRGGTSVGELLKKRFGIEPWEWTRLKVVYEAAQAGDEDAAEFVREIDAKQTTVSAAYGQLHRNLQAETDRQNLPKTVRLRAVYDVALRSNGFAETTARAVRLDVPVNTSGMEPDDVADCIVQLRAAGRNMKELADRLSRSQGGT
ncbi:hypothetical protein SAMN05421854_110101 [Amycolatopsis rubida]|uniref:Uncharacterized protein n=2 Tax=Amycolatopsis rubida TaxID=112413 RepID=A0A1I5X8U3_9PSEU|nr:hypothetical protein SAMN05421854_110101 [Amycolatopsis rubida]